MLKKIALGSLISSLIIGFGGCGPAQVQVKPMSNLSVSDRSQVLTFSFPKVDPISGEELIFDPGEYNFSYHIAKLSKYPEFHIVRGGVVRKYRGLKVVKHPDKYILDYANGNYHPSTDSWYLNGAKFTLFYKRISDNQISFTLDDKYRYQPCSDAIGVDIDPLDTLQNLEKDSKNVLSKLKTIKITLKRRYHLKGDINNKFNADSIYANFKRLMGNYNWRYYYGGKEKLTEVKKENTFNLDVNGKKVPLHVEVYPYRNGSKVQYEAYIPYTIDSDGITSLKKSDIDALKNKIADVVND